MCLEEGVAGKELDQNAADAPDVARVGPAETEDNLRGSVVARRDDGGVILILKGGGAKVNQPHLGIEQDPSLAGLAADVCRRRGDPAIVGKGLIRVVTEENVLGFEVGVDQVEIVQDCRRPRSATRRGTKRGEREREERKK